MHGDLRGFYGAPVTYAFSLAVGAASSASLLFDRGALLALDRDAVVTRGHALGTDWNSVCASGFSGLAVSVGLYAVFQFRVLERQMGARKFGSALLFVLLFSGALELTALLSVPTLARRIPGGPYAVLGALSVYFYSTWLAAQHVSIWETADVDVIATAEYIPKLQPRSLSLYGLNFSDKSSTYLLLMMVRQRNFAIDADAADILLARDVNTLIPFVGGSCLGLLFNSTPLGRLRLPSIVCSLFGVLRPMFDVVPASAVALQRQRRALEAQRRFNARHNRPGHPAAAAVAGQGFRDQLLPGAGGVMGAGAPAVAGGLLPPQMAAAPPSEDAIQQLTVSKLRAIWTGRRGELTFVLLFVKALGFDRERALQALQSTGNNVEAAANRLLNGL
ncbi:hypothetical protein BBJ28_00019970 [Nothophytophthora sp. Chile5]|nr:hypothetical protein BBJ28_00019970 [Nothophytophthora sp. Chile5]